ncbi:MAG: T9SS type A sorting domain-containing protein [Cytophagales bacterium]|nr:T9SS type A sorting domain-containing protein [Cytophaga sp.]
MRNNTLSLILYGLMGAFMPLFAQNRTVVQFNDSWKFLKSDAVGAQGPTFNDVSWENVTTPHSWNGVDGQDGGNNYYRGIGWYRKHFTLAQTGKRVYVKFDASNMTTDVYVNNVQVGTHTGGYSAFIFDITSQVTAGDNVIAVKVNNAATIIAAPLDADFTFFGGLNKSVELLYLNAVHIDPTDFASPGVYITQTTTSSDKSDLSIKTLVKNDQASAATVTVTSTILNAAGATVTTATSSGTVGAGVQVPMTGTATIINPTLWNGLTNPYLYKVKTEISVAGTVVDVVTQPLGIRYYSVDVNNGFFLNGVSYRLHGVAHHEDYPDKGRALSDLDRKTDLDMLKDMGCNYLRLSHYQHGQYTYNYLDSVGIVAWTEIPLIDNIDPANSTAFSDNAKQQLTELIKQNYNHPCVIVWSLSNEITYKNNKTPYPGPLVQSLNDLAKQLDPNRLTASAAMFSNESLNFFSDIYSCNQYNGWYYNTYNDVGPWADTQHSTYSAKAFGISEYGAGANVKQHEPLNPLVAEPLNYGPWHPEEYQALFHEAHWQQIKARPYLWSTSVWVAFDFASDGRNEGLQPGINDKGLITRDRKTKKDAYYYYKANWSTTPFVYLTGRRFDIRYDSVVIAKAYSNCDSVIIKLNNVALAVNKSTTTIFSWTGLNLKRGKNMVTAVGYKKGQLTYDTIYWTFNGPFTINPPAAAIQINFEVTATVTPAGYLKDAGNIYGARGNGQTYGWDKDVTANARERNSTEPKLFDTFMQMQYLKGYNFWEIALPTGYYKVSIAAGDPNFFDSYNAISAEGKLIVADAVYSAKRHAYGSDTVLVSDGKLTIRPATGSGATNTKIDYIHIQQVNGMSTGINTAVNEGINLYPNPASSDFNITGLRTKANVRVMDIVGNQIKLYSNVPAGETFNIPVEMLRKGTYIIEITEEATKTYSKIIVQ